MARNVARKANTMLVTWEGWLYLRERQHEERSVTGKPFSEKSIARFKSNFDSYAKNGWKQIMEYDFGGCVGSPKNAWEEHRWTEWSISQMMNMLDEKGLPYKESEPIEVIDVYF